MPPTWLSQNIERVHSEQYFASLKWFRHWMLYFGDNAK